VLGSEIHHDANIRNSNAFVRKKEQRMTDFVDEKTTKAMGSMHHARQARSGAQSAGGTCPQFRSSMRVRRRGVNWRRPNSGEQRAEGRDRDITVYSSEQTRKTAD
jgi:hypothetical protein